MNGKGVDAKPGNVMSNGGGKDATVKQKGQLVMDVLLNEASKILNGKKNVNTKMDVKEFLKRNNIQ